MKLTMKKIFLLLGLAVALAGFNPHARAAEAPKKADPNLEQRIADLEAYVGNGARGSDAADAKITSKLDGVPGAGANAWQMTSAALVLFMTLPGLALFYGGLVRRKNVLSVMAQCFFITGLVTILWWICGYSLIFHSGNPFFGKLDFAFFKDVTSAPNG